MPPSLILFALVARRRLLKIPRKQLSNSRSSSELEDIELATTPSSPETFESRDQFEAEAPATPDSSKKLRRSFFFPMSTHSAPRSAPVIRLAPRSESMAYPKSNTSTMLSKIQYYCRQHARTIVLSSCLGIILTLLIAFDVIEPVSGGPSFRGSSTLGTGHVHWGGAIHAGAFYAEDAVLADGVFRFAAVTDLDELSKVADASKPEFYSIFLGGTLKHTTGSKYPYAIDLELDATRRLVTKHNEAGRGAEFSELTLYNHRLLTFDDRTGDVFEILNTANGGDSFVVPRFVVTEGEGDTDKGMKWEWSTVKNGELYMGSMGKEYTRKDGTVKNRNNLWIGVLNDRGELRREDWTKQYGVVRKALGAESPGYMIIEAVNWSPILNKWVFLPRRISQEAYDENKDELKGGHQLVLVSESFTNPQVVDIKMESLDPLKGFSTFAFVPGTNDRHAIAVRSVEENCVDFTPQCQQRSYFIVFDVLTGEVLAEEVEYPDKVKFEGIEFVDMHSIPK